MGLGRSCQQFENWLLRGHREPISSMGLYHYAMYVYDSYNKEPQADFASHLYSALHPACAKRIQKLRLDESYRVPRLGGITPPSPADDKKKEQFALMMIMLFMPLALPGDADAFDEEVVLELLGDLL